MAVKTLPNDIEAEQSVLGSMFLSNMHCNRLVKR